MARFSSAIALAAFAAPILAQSPGCGNEPTLDSGVHELDGRQYTLLVPDGYDSSNQHHLVFGLHWLGASMDAVTGGDGIEPWYGLDTRADGSAIFVAPNGNNNGWANEGGADVAFVDAIIEQVEADLCVDQASRFATGFSFGGGMSYALACARATDFRAVSVLGAGQISGCDGGNDPIAYLGLHGIADDVLNIDGGIGLSDTFVGNNGCNPSDVALPEPGSGDFVRTDFEGCSHPVSFVAYDGGHDAAPLGVGNPLGPDSTWEFFMSS